MYYDLINKKEVSIGAIKKANPNTSFPKVLPDYIEIPIIEGIIKQDDGSIIENIIGHNKYHKILVIDNTTDIKEYHNKVLGGVQLINGVPTVEYIEVPYTEEEMSRTYIDQIAEAKKARADKMLEGATYTLNGVEYQISFTKEDGDGLVQVKSAFELGLTQTIIHFSNGTELPISPSEFAEFASWFVNKRNEFF